MLFSLNAPALTKRAFIQKVLSQDVYFEKDQIYVDIKQIEVDTSRVSYAGWNADLTATLVNRYYDIGKDTDSKSIYKQHIDSNTQSVGLIVKKRFLSNPSSLAISAARSTPDTDIERYKQREHYDKYNVKTFDNAYKVKYTYPLLRHDSNASSLRTYHRNVWHLKREKLDFNDAQEGFLVARLKQYLLWIFYQENADIYQNYQQLLQAVEPLKTADKSKLNTAILRANQDILTNDSKLQSLKQALVVALNDPSLLLQKPKINTAASPQIITNLEQYLRRNVRILLKYAIDKKLKNIDLAYYKNQSLVKLDLSIGLEQYHNKGNTLTTKYDNDSVDYFVGLILNIPIGVDVNNQKDIKVAQLNVRKLDIDYNNKLNDILSDTQALIVALHLGKKTLNKYKNLMLDVKNEANLAFDNYVNQSISIKELIDSYQQKRDVYLGYVDAATHYQQNLLLYKDTLDGVLPKNEHALNKYGGQDEQANISPSN